MGAARGDSRANRRFLLEFLPQLRQVRRQDEADLKRGLGRAPLPDALVRKYPNADREWGRQWVFPASSHYLDRATGIRHRHRAHESVIQEVVSQAAHRAGLAKETRGIKPTGLGGLKPRR